MDFLDSFKSFKDFDWRSLKKLTSSRAADDLNKFLEGMPQHVSQTLLVSAAIAWAAAGGLGLYTSIQMQKLTELRIQFQEAEALRPVVPEIRNVGVRPNEVSDFVGKTEKIYSGLSMKAQGSTILIKANETRSFGQFREAIGHVLNGGSGWQVAVEHLCVGRECEKNPLSAKLRINKVSVTNPGE